MKKSACVLCMIMLFVVGTGNASEPTTLSLGAPHILKARWESRLLRVAELDGDLHQELLVCHPNRHLLERYDWIPRENKRLSREIPLEMAPQDMVVADLDGNGHDDLIFAIPEEKLTLWFYYETNRQVKKLDAYPIALAVDDLDRDGHMDLVAQEARRLVLFYGPLMLKEPVKERILRYPAASPGTAVETGDLDNNGLADLFMVHGHNPDRLMCSFQKPGRLWEGEQHLTIPESARLSAWKYGKDATGLLSLTARNGEIRLYGLQQESPQQESPLEGPRYLSMEPDLWLSRGMALALSLRPGKGEDFIWASGSAARIDLFFNRQGVLDGHHQGPGLNGMDALRVWQRQGTRRVVALSREEKTAACFTYQPERGLSVPRFMDFPEPPLTLAVGDLDGSGEEDVAVIVEKEGWKLHWYADPESPEDFEEENLRETALPLNPDNRPVSMRAEDWNNDGLVDLLVFHEYGDPCLLLQKAGGEWKKLSPDSHAGMRIFRQTAPRDWLAVDLDQDGKKEMLLRQDRFIRAYRLEGEDNWELVEQFNGPNADTRVAAVACPDVDGDGQPEVVFLDNGNHCFQLCRRGADGLWETRPFLEGKTGNYEGLLALDANGDGREDLMGYGTEAPQLFLAGARANRLELLWRKSAELEGEEDSRYGLLERGNFFPDMPEEQILAVEDREHLLTVFAWPEGEASPKPIYQFNVFDDESNRSGRQSGRMEPREMRVRDVNGDRRPDLILLIHDNIVWYPQQEINDNQ